LQEKRFKPEQEKATDFEDIEDEIWHSDISSSHLDVTSEAQEEEEDELEITYERELQDEALDLDPESSEQVISENFSTTVL
jgi:hypothetical protein